MLEWMRGFSREVGVPEVGIESSLDRRLSDGRLFVWDDGGVVAMVGTGPPVVGVVRLGPVYTPPGVRRRGYATALVADVSRDQLAGGATQCMLYADLANVASNSIYKAVGYRCCSDAQEYHFISDQTLRASSSESTRRSPLGTRPSEFSSSTKEALDRPRFTGCSKAKRERNGYVAPLSRRTGARRTR